MQYSNLSCSSQPDPFLIYKIIILRYHEIFFRLTTSRCPGMAAGAVSLRKSHDIVILSFCNIVKGQANNVQIVYSKLKHSRTSFCAHWKAKHQIFPIISIIIGLDDQDLKVKTLQFQDTGILLKNYIIYPSEMLIK